MSGDLILEIVKTSGARVISCEGVPGDAVFLRIAQDVVGNQVLIFYEHPTFPWVEPGCVPEMICPMFTTYHGEAVLKANASTENYGI